MQALALNHGTQRLSAAYFFSKCGEFAFETAFAVAVVTLTEADFLLIGLVYFFRYLPSALFSPIGGWLADHRQKKHTLISAELLKSVVAALLFVLFEFAEATVAVVIIASMVMTALDCLYTPSFRAYFPDIVDDGHLASVNSGVQVIEDVSSIIGPLIFSLISIVLDASYAFAFFSVSLLLSAACSATLVSSVTTSKGRFDVWAIYKDTTRSVGSLRKLNTPLFTVICCTTVCAMFATSVIRFILPASVMDHFQSEAAVGYIFSLLAFGTVIGGMLYVTLNKSTTARSVIIYWLLYGGLFLLAAVALQFNTYLFIVLLLCVGFVGAFVDIAIITNIQTLSSPNEVGKNFSLYYFTAVIGDAVSGLIASLMFLLVGPATFVGMTFMLCIAPLGWSAKKDVTDKDCL
ncbi:MULTISPECIES: MFS transporter [unclassified Pseudomonas]|uniref:MFS transporter n=1 Tax=unclassified Pseudomonas TaxID=196821 RepID=UPI000888FA82|nr:MULTISPECIES: MFS transporter [unclassified Pseudomonas]QVM99089.1 MFS transporter [Pseudomonas sp. SORT22]UVL59070.1 MFS transporter [Pseudomonas sp. B21-035]SDQ25998.1 Transmembrane secretion effector [Pseudomonas sp. UC 17F4]